MKVQICCDAANILRNLDTVSHLCYNKRRKLFEIIPKGEKQ